MIEELKRRLDAITGTDPVSIARRLLLIEKINELMAAQEDE